MLNTNKTTLGRVISADSHIVESPDWWLETIDKKYRDRAPRIVRSGEGPGMQMVNFPGYAPFPVKAVIPKGVDQCERKGSEYWDTTPGAWDPADRISAMDRDGVSAEVLYPTYGMWLFGTDDAEIRAVLFRAHNDRIAQFCAHDPTRLAAIAMLPTDRVTDTIRELERCAALGHRGGMIASTPPPDRPYGSREYDPLWAAACASNMPLSLHITTGIGKRKFDAAKLQAAPLQFRLQNVIEIQETLTTMIEGGVFERFPDLRIVTVESGVGWMTGYSAVLDFAWKRHDVPLKRKPGDYIRENIFATFQQDYGLKGNVLGGVKNFMWASDFPHGDSTWPVSRDVIRSDFEGLSTDDLQTITFGNAARLYRFE